MLSVAMSYDIDQITQKMEIIRVSTQILVSKVALELQLLEFPD